jgi:CheY-like chemotaxis protein
MSKSSMIDTSQESYPLVMVVDDDPMNIAVIEAMLEEKNVLCDTAPGGTAAINLFKERLEKFKDGEARMYKLILLDFSMPDMNGPTVASIIRDLFDDSADEPFICCCTAYGDETFK